MVKMGERLLLEVMLQRLEVEEPMVQMGGLAVREAVEEDHSIMRQMAEEAINLAVEEPVVQGENLAEAAEELVGQERMEQELLLVQLG